MRSFTVETPGKRIASKNGAMEDARQCVNSSSNDLRLANSQRFVIGDSLGDRRSSTSSPNSLRLEQEARNWIKDDSFFPTLTTRERSSEILNLVRDAEAVKGIGTKLRMWKERKRGADQVE